MARKKKNKNKDIQYTLDNISDFIDTLDTTDFDSQDFSIRPENWHPDKIMFLIEKNIYKFKLRQIKKPTTHIKHNDLVYCLRSIGITSLNLTQSFSPTYLGYTQEYFLWKFSNTKKTSSNINLRESEINKIKNKFKEMKESWESEEKPSAHYSVEHFEDMPIRISTIYEQKANIVRLFKEFYLELKKVSNPNNINSEKTLVEAVLFIIPFVLYDFEYLSATRKSSMIQTDNFDNHEYSEHGISTTLKANALFKKPTISVSTSMNFSDNVEKYNTHTEITKNPI